jgi:hypothetical protein
VNPKHLFLGTNTENIHDMHEKGRGYKGTRHHDNKLTVKQVLSIRKDWRSTVEIGNEYGVSTSMVSDIRSRKKWGHLPEEKNVEERTYGANKLTKAQIIAIRSDVRTQKEIANEYGLRQAYVSKIKLGRIWGEVIDNSCIIDNSVVKTGI